MTRHKHTCEYVVKSGHCAATPAIADAVTAADTKDANPSFMLSVSQAVVATRPTALQSPGPRSGSTKASGVQDAVNFSLQLFMTASANGAPG